MGTTTIVPPLSADELARHMRTMVPDFRQFPLKRLEKEVPVGCVDGRHTGCVAGAPGGNAGLLIVLLAAWERMHVPLKRSQIEELFPHYLNRFGSFYLHSDEDAQHALAQWLGLSHYTSAEIDALVMNPPPDMKPRLLEGLLMPEHTGCGHLRLMLSDPTAYEVRTELVQDVLRTFFTTLWQNDARLVFDVLRGKHEERGVIRMHVHQSEDDRLSPDFPIVSACPSHGDVEVFVYHPSAVAYLQEQHIRFFAEMRWTNASDEARFRQEKGYLQTLHLTRTLETLAGHLPVFDVHVRPHTEAQPADVEIIHA